MTLLQRHHARPCVRWDSFSSPEDEAVHFHVNPRLGFPASQIQELQFHEDAPPDMMVNFMGLTGPSGVLPYVYSELILERLRAKDRSLAAFFDIFNHRAISLFYRAWQRSRFPVTYAAGARDLLHASTCSTCSGIGTQGLRDRQAIEDEALLHYVSLVAMQSRSAVALEQILADYFEVPVEIRAVHRRLVHAGRRNPVRDERRGFAVDARSARARWWAMRFGIGRRGCAFASARSAWSATDDFLPGAQRICGAARLTRFFTNECLDFEVQLVLDRTEVPAVELDFDAKHPARLGWVSWPRPHRMSIDPDDTILTLYKTGP